MVYFRLKVMERILDSCFCYYFAIEKSGLNSFRTLSTRIRQTETFSLCQVYHQYVRKIYRYFSQHAGKIQQFIVVLKPNIFAFYVS
jgi:hypothetical protein